MSTGRRRNDDPPRQRVCAAPWGDSDHVDYKDTTLLRGFVSDKGKIRSRRVTRASARQQRLIATAIENAREMALLPYPSSTKQH
ncbi:30S ribosomal protein S18 [Nocardiopsis sp. MG754419]|uniref:30S ribosomal protein S18 n=1 Tax=Nocardiopsis sp. MG754419 TaxID=2259865 RepID=UPI001BAB2E9D|nr:30S ribosomal protein S18 [Nocardiopsis sp. MG754419]MBR8744282.1 30S ribosomal protein S18 [Nocardiopsis sp. MG754419]